MLSLVRLFIPARKIIARNKGLSFNQVIKYRFFKRSRDIQMRVLGQRKRPTKMIQGIRQNILNNASAAVVDAYALNILGGRQAAAFARDRAKTCQ